MKDKEPYRHPLYYAHYMFNIKKMEDAPAYLFAVVNDEKIRVLKICWCTWYSSGDHEAFGSIILNNGRMILAEKLNGFTGLTTEV